MGLEATVVVDDGWGGGDVFVVNLVVVLEAVDVVNDVVIVVD